jgi:prepilin-type N-terminal cleavage/methylation domain-containing protein
LPRPRRSAEAGFTLIEALVALTILLAFAATLAPLLFQARQIIGGADDRVAAQLLLRALLADPVAPESLADLSRDGESAGVRWHVSTEPTAIEAMFPPSATRSAAALPAGQPPNSDPRPDWIAYRVVATVAWGRGLSLSAETVRLGLPATDSTE